MATVTTVTYDSTTDTNAVTITLTGLATSSTRVVGRESTVISNASNLYVDTIVRGQIMTGSATLTASQIDVWLYAELKVASSTPTYPSPVTGSDAAITFVVETIQRLILADVLITNTTANTAYAIKPFSVAQLCGGVMPLRWGIVVSHSTGQNLNATATNHWIHYTGIKYTHT